MYTNQPKILVCEPNVVQLSGTPFGDVNCYYINFGGKLIYTARLWAQILRASEAIWAAILAQIPKNFSHMYLHMSSNRYISRFYEQSSRWPKLMTINSTSQPICIYWNTRKTCWGISVGEILHCRPSYAQRRHFVSERSGQRDSG